MADGMVVAALVLATASFVVPYLDRFLRHLLPAAPAPAVDYVVPVVFPITAMVLLAFAPRTIAASGVARATGGRVKVAWVVTALALAWTGVRLLAFLFFIAIMRSVFSF